MSALGMKEKMYSENIACFYTIHKDTFLCPLFALIVMHFVRQNNFVALKDCLSSSKKDCMG